MAPPGFAAIRDAGIADSPHSRRGPTLEGYALLSHALISAFQGRIAVVSSFGAESALLLAWVAEIDRTTPILFLETGKHFPETLAYRNRLVAELGLADVRSVNPPPARVAMIDPTGLLHTVDPDTCCDLRKTQPLAEALEPFKAWVTGRKRYQSPTRAQLPFLELEAGRIKINPLAETSAAEIEAEIAARDLPRHPLAGRGYSSIGCAVCTTAVAPGEDPRAGRWRGQAKTECGIHHFQAANI